MDRKLLTVPVVCQASITRACCGRRVPALGNEAVMAGAGSDLLGEGVVERDLQVANCVAWASRLGGDGGVPVGACEVVRVIRLAGLQSGRGRSEACECEESELHCCLEDVGLGGAV